MIDKHGKRRRTDKKNLEKFRTVLLIYFYKANILYFTKFIYGLNFLVISYKAFLKLTGQNAYNDGHSDIIVDIYRCTLMK